MDPSNPKPPHARPKTQQRGRHRIELESIAIRLECTTACDRRQQTLYTIQTNPNRTKTHATTTRHGLRRAAARAHRHHHNQDDDDDDHGRGGRPAGPSRRPSRRCTLHRRRPRPCPPQALHSEQDGLRLHRAPGGRGRRPPPPPRRVRPRRHGRPAALAGASAHAVGRAAGQDAGAAQVLLPGLPSGGQAAAQALVPPHAGAAHPAGPADPGGALDHPPAANVPGQVHLPLRRHLLHRLGRDRPPVRLQDHCPAHVPAPRARLPLQVRHHPDLLPEHVRARVQPRLPNPT